MPGLWRDKNIKQVPGDENPSDILTKYVVAGVLSFLLGRVGGVFGVSVARVGLYRQRQTERPATEQQGPRAASLPSLRLPLLPNLYPATFAQKHHKGRQQHNNHHANTKPSR